MRAFRNSAATGARSRETFTAIADDAHYAFEDLQALLRHIQHPKLVTQHRVDVVEFSRIGHVTFKFERLRAGSGLQKLLRCAFSDAIRRLALGREDR